MESATQTKPRFRNDLVAQQLEEEGVQYVEVTDPNSGSTFRFYDVEYSIACGMNGERDLPALVDWALADLGIETNTDEMATVMSTLADLGYLDAGEGIELGAPGGQPQSNLLGDGPTSTFELGAPGAAPLGKNLADEDAQLRKIEPIELGAPGGAPPAANGASSNAVELASDELEDYHSTVTEMPKPPADAASPPPPPGTDDDMSFAGLMETEAGKKGMKPLEARKPERTDQTPTRPIELTADAPPEPKRPTTAALYGEDEPTNLPGAVPDPDDDDVSVDLSAHLSLDKKEVEDAVRASRVMMVPEIPADLLTSGSAEDDIDKTKPAMPLPAPPSTSQLNALADDVNDTVQGSMTPSSSEPAFVAAGALPLPERPSTGVTTRPIDATQSPAAATAGAKKGMGAGWLLLLFVVLGGGFALYWFALRGNADEGYKKAPAAPSNKTGAPGASGLLPPGGETPLVPVSVVNPVAKLEQRTGAVAEAKAVTGGRVAWLAPPAKDVIAGEPIVKLQGFQRWQQQLNQSAGRLDFYQGELDKAKAANNAAAVEKAEKKVVEKKDLLTQAETEMAKVIVSAPSAGKVELVAKLGALVVAGDVVARVTGGGPQLLATFDTGANSAIYPGAGATCAVAQKGAPDKRAACVVEGVAGAKVTVRLVDGSPFKPGDEVELQAAK